MDAAIAYFDAYPLAAVAAGLLTLVAAAVVAHWITIEVLLRSIRRGLSRVGLGQVGENLRPVSVRLARIVPTFIIYHGVQTVPHLSPAVVLVTRNVAAAFMILTLVMAIAAALTLVNTIYSRRPEAASRPIKGYLQVVKIILFVIATILILATLSDQSPLLLLSGMGAMAAILMLVFKDTILSLVASVQLTSNDMLRVGDWIEMPELNADGNVIDIALHTVKVQNWDKTITTIPTWRLISESFKNWRGMEESGGRRIMRALLIDQASVRFLGAAECERMRRFTLIDNYLSLKQDELEAWNGSRLSADGDAVNARRVTNIGTFRAYVAAYMKAHSGINQTMTQMVRQLAPTPQGLPLEIYGFTATTSWIAYEGIQSDIFDHLIAILPEFGLQLYQQPSGRDVTRLGAGPQAQPPAA